MPRGRLPDYYMEYRSWQADSTASSFAPLGEDGSDDEAGGDVDVGGVRGDGGAAMFNAFAQRRSEVWRRVMQIRKSSQHHECNMRFKCRQELRGHGSLTEKMELAP